MDSASAIKKFNAAQNIFRVAAVLQLTSNMWPKPLLIPDKVKYDYIIVGGGTAGCVIASRLVELKHVNVLLIEAGGNPPLASTYHRLFPYLKNSEVDWQMKSEKESSLHYHKKGIAEIPQGKMLGGTSSLNYMTYVRGNIIDYALWSTYVNDSSWSYDEILPFFKKAEMVIDAAILKSKPDRDLYGKRGRIKLRKFHYKSSKKYLSAFKEMDNKILVDINSKNPLGFTNVLRSCGTKFRQSTAFTHLRRVKNNKRLYVMTNALVINIVFDADKNAIGVVVSTKDKNIITLRAHIEVILTAGVFKTPQLLMLSGIGPHEHLNAKKIKTLVNLPVGKNLQDHPTVISFFKMFDLKEIPYANLTSYSFPVIEGHVALETIKKYPDYVVHSFLINNPEMLLTFCAISFGFQNALCDRIGKVFVGSQIYMALNHLPYPKSRGEVSLKSNNAYDQPIIKLGLYTDVCDLENHAVFLKHFHSKILRTSYFKRVGAKLLDPNIQNCGKLNVESINYWQCYASAMVLTMNNNVGTCSMGTVVDHNLLVKGVNRLRIADASVIPTPVASGTAASVIMIAEKVSKIIKNDYRNRNREKYY